VAGSDFTTTEVIVLHWSFLFSLANGKESVRQPTPIVGRNLYRSLSSHHEQPWLINPEIGYEVDHDVFYILYAQQKAGNLGDIYGYILTTRMNGSLRG
jgi:hypothetical protein